MSRSIKRMSGSHTSPLAPTPPDDEVLLPAVARLGVPVLVFGVVFLLLSFALTFLVSPDRFPVRMGDKIVRLSDLQAEEYSLRIKQAELLEERERILRDSDAPVLQQAQKIRADFVPLGPVLLDVERVRKSFIVDQNDPIRFPKISFDASMSELTLGGDVRDPNGRSVSILSSFVDALRKLPSLQTDSGRTPVTDPPEYTQKPLLEGGTVSSFTIVITIPHGE